MLKRLRPISPPPSGPSIPLVSDPPESYRREPKRRRILPPSLDGQSRCSMFHTDDDDGEEDDDEMNFADGRNPSGVASVGPTIHNTEYKSANTVLHDLHALHRHRLIFSSPSPSLVHPDHYHYPQSPVKAYLPLTPDHSRALETKDTSGRQGKLPFEEVQSVKERYEDTNRLLGSLFLTRRKQLDQHNT